MKTPVIFHGSLQALSKNCTSVHNARCNYSVDHQHCDIGNSFSFNLFVKQMITLGLESIELMIVSNTGIFPENSL